jgi:ABC-type branched-subunit amino acid transport system ATPase component
VPLHTSSSYDVQPHVMKTVSISVFSAKNSFSLHTPSPNHALVTADIPEFKQHVHIAPADSRQSQLWIDGLYGEAIKKRDFIALLRSQGIPFPLQQPITQQSANSYHYVSPECLSNRKTTILEAWGLVAPIQQLLESNLHALCPACGGRIIRIPSTTQLKQHILEGYQGVSITLLASSAHGTLQDWALNNGFSCSVDGSSHFAVELDSDICSKEQIARISRILASLWKLEEVVLTCRSRDNISSFSKSGWCTKCEELKQFPDVNSISSYLMGGPPPKGAHCLLVDSELSLPTLLETPLSVLPHQPRILERIITLSTQFGLEMYPLGTPISHLSSHAIAILSLAISLQDSSSHILVDIPQGLLSREQTELISLLNAQHSSSRSIVFVQDPIAQQIPPVANLSISLDQTTLIGTLISNQGQTVELYTNSIISLSRKKFGIGSLASLLVDGNQHGAIQFTGEKVATVCLPTFCHAPRGSTQTVADLLGLSSKLAELYAMGFDAQHAGLTPRNFSPHSKGKEHFTCNHCKGLGLELTYRREIHRPEAQTCRQCDGMRFTDPVSSCLFKGIPYGTVYNLNIRRVESLFANIPKIGKTLALAVRLSLGDLPIGMPISLLSHSELRRLRLIEALINRKKTTPNLFLLEDPSVGWGMVSQKTILELLQQSTTELTTTWVLLEH